MLVKQEKGEHRTVEQLKEQYEIEKELASRLRNASRQERRRFLYSSLYDEFYRRVPQHPHLTRKSSSEDQIKAVSSQMRFLHSFLNRDSTFLEIGPGDCALSLEVAKFVKKVYAVDVSEEITKRSTFPQNFRLILSDGCNIPLPANSVNVAYSNQLMEHLHPDDAFEQLQNIHKALTPNGVYICITPNRLNGPHDISKYFDTVATGFHLREYTITELSNLFRTVGFLRIRVGVGAKGIYMISPSSPCILCEKVLSILPSSPRKAVARSVLMRLLLGIRLVGTK